MAREPTLIKTLADTPSTQTYPPPFLFWSGDAMNVLTTSTALWPWNLGRYREVAPFLPNQSMKPMAPARYFAILLATGSAHGLSLSR